MLTKVKSKNIGRSAAGFRPKIITIFCAVLYTV